VNILYFLSLILTLKVTSRVMMYKIILFLLQKNVVNLYFVWVMYDLSS
jgi:hypothetical protein